jgi:hypothetical protein
MFHGFCGNSSLIFFTVDFYSRTMKYKGTFTVYVRTGIDKPLPIEGAPIYYAFSFFFFFFPSCWLNYRPEIW